MKKVMFGTLVISAGLLLLGFNMGILSPELKPVVFSWQMLLIALGLINLSSRHGHIFGLILIGVGGFFIIPILPFVNSPDRFVNLFWPALLILAGILIILKRKHRPWEHKNFQHKVISESRFESGFIHEENVFSGSKQRITQEFKGGRISNVFGGTELDLSQATLGEGKNVLEIECVFGGIKIIVPSDWTVTIRVEAVMGAFQDKRMIVKPNTNSDRELIIKGTAVFGGGEIKSF